MKIIFLSTSLTIFYAAFTSATPSLDAKCDISLRAPANGNGVFFDENCRVAYVLPPERGRVEIGSLARNTNMQFCSSVQIASEITETTMKSINIIAEKIYHMIKAYKPLSDEVFALRTSLDRSRVKMDTAKKGLANAEADLDMLKAEILDAKTIYESCVVLNSADHPQCLENKEEYENAKEEFKKFYVTQFMKKRDAADRAVGEFRLKESRYQSEFERYTEALKPMLDLQEKLYDINTRVMDLYKEYARLEGAIGKITWRMNWIEVLDGYRQLNSDLRIGWQKLPIRQATFLASVKDPYTSLNLGVPAILSANIPGAYPTGFAGMGKGERVSLEQDAPQDGNVSAMFGSSISGQVVLSLAGACSYYSELMKNGDSEALTKTITANVVYSFDLAARRGYTAHYNLSNMLRHIEEKAERGGLFWTNAIHDIVEGQDASDWFNIEFSSDVAEFKYSPTEQDEITTIIKKELMDKALRQISILNAAAATPTSAPDLVDSGARTGSAALGKCFHQYCQVGSLILGVLDSIFGRSNATANFHRNNRAWVTETINGHTIVDRSSGVSFE